MERKDIARSNVRKLRHYECQSFFVNEIQKNATYINIQYFY